MYNPNGYIRKGGVLEHRKIVEEVLKRKLSETNVVHHVDYNKSNNTNSNLVVCPDRAYHKLLHARQKVQDLGGTPGIDRWCSYCQCLHNKEDFSPKPSKHDGLASACKKSSSNRWVALGYNKLWKIKLYKQYWNLKNKPSCNTISWLV